MSRFSKTRRTHKLLIASLCASSIWLGAKYSAEISDGMSNVWNNAKSYWSTVGEEVGEHVAGFFHTDPREFLQDTANLEKSINDMMTTYARAIGRGEYDAEMKLSVSRLEGFSGRLLQSLSPQARSKLLRQKDALAEFQQYLQAAGQNMKPEDLNHLLDAADAAIHAQYSKQTKLAKNIDAFLETLPYLTTPGVEAIRSEMDKRIPEEDRYATTMRMLTEAPKPVRQNTVHVLTDSLFASSTEDGLAAVVYGLNKIPEEERSNFAQRVVENLPSTDKEKLQGYLCPASVSVQPTEPVQEPTVVDKYHTWFKGE